MNQSVPWPWPLQSQNCEKRLCWIHGLRYFITEQPEQTETPFPILMLRFPFHSTESGLCPQMDTSVPTHLVSPPSELTLPASHLENPCKLLQWCLSDNHRIPCLSPTPRMPNHPTPFTGISNYLDKYAQSSQFFYFPRDGSLSWPPSGWANTVRPLYRPTHHYLPDTWLDLLFSWEDPSFSSSTFFWTFTHCLSSLSTQLASSPSWGREISSLLFAQSIIPPLTSCLQTHFIAF